LDTGPLKSKVAVRIVQILVIAVLLYFIGYRIIGNWNEIKAYDWHVNYLLLLLSLAVMLLALFVMSSVLAVIFGAFSKDVSSAKAFKIAYLSQLGRYIPGKIWQVFGMIYLAGKEGISRTEAITSFALAQLFATPPAILIVCLYLVFSGRLSLAAFDITVIGYVLGAVVLTALVVLLKPSWLKGLVNYLLARLERETIDFQVEKKSGGKILFAYFVGWNLYGLAFYLFLVSVSDFPAGHFLQAAGVFCAAYLIGYWSVLTPGGIGVREAVLALLLVPYFSPGVAAAVAAFARLWSIAGELVASGIALKVR
jgi:uncharacterized membrane protein YbhN (UPF0104 family)